MKKRTLAAVVAATALSITCFAAPAVHAATPPKANTSAVLVKTWPASTNVSSPKPGQLVGLYHNGVKKVVSTPKCASGTAEQGVFYNWLTISGGHTPYFQKPIYIIRCL